MQNHPQFQRVFQGLGKLLSDFLVLMVVVTHTVVRLRTPHTVSRRQSGRAIISARAPCSAPRLLFQELRGIGSAHSTPHQALLIAGSAAAVGHAAAHETDLEAGALCGSKYKEIGQKSTFGKFSGNRVYTIPIALECCRDITTIIPNLFLVPVAPMVPPSTIIYGFSSSSGSSRGLVSIHTG